MATKRTIAKIKARADDARGNPHVRAAAQKKLAALKAKEAAKPKAPRMTVEERRRWAKAAMEHLERVMPFPKTAAELEALRIKREAEQAATRAAAKATKASSGSSHAAPQPESQPDPEQPKASAGPSNWSSNGPKRGGLRTDPDRWRAYQREAMRQHRARKRAAAGEPAPMASWTRDQLIARAVQGRARQGAPLVTDAPLATDAHERFRVMSAPSWDTRSLITHPVRPQRA
jgi:hypothetical protein